MNFNGKTVLITGASKGIGKATAIAFAKAGATIGLNYKSDDAAAQNTLLALKKGPHQLFKADVSNKEKAKGLIDDFIKEFGRIDILINNAGIAYFHQIDEIDYTSWSESFEHIINTNLISVANLCYCASQEMIKTGGGRIINVSSRGAFRGEPNMPAYGASKAGLNALSQSLAKALAKYNIYVNVIAPGFTETDMATATLSDSEKEILLNETPLKRLAKPEEIAHAILFLASKGAEYTTGAILDINGASYLRS